MSVRPPAKIHRDDADVLAKIAAMPQPHRSLGERLHQLILDSAPTLHPRVWYGMPGYAKAKDGPVVCFFRADEYMTFGLTEKANFAREEGVPHQLLASAWFFTTLDEATEAELASIVRKATSWG
jgi:hypothetical protein